MLHWWGWAIRMRQIPGSLELQRLIGHVLLWELLDMESVQFNKENEVEDDVREIKPVDITRIQ